MRELIFATTNTGKLAELKELLGESWKVRSAGEFPSVPEVEETADTFAGNAALKAMAFLNATGVSSLGDDSGLCVDALDGRPGLYSARYANTAEARIARLLGELEGVPAERRTARFVCELCLAIPGGKVIRARGECEGAIGFFTRGTEGFGYDPIFVLPSGKTMAELTRAEKSEISHRGRAFQALKAALEEIR